MLKEIESLLRPNIRDLEPYTCARDEYSGEAKAWLDANENSILGGLNRYPDPLQRKVKQKIGELRGVEPENIFSVSAVTSVSMCFIVHSVVRVSTMWWR